MACHTEAICSKTFWKTLSLLCFSLASVCHAQMPTPIAAMAQNEMTARLHKVRYAYVSEERSERTGMHLWRERVVEIGNIQVRRLIGIDGRALTPQEEATEAERLRNLVNHPDAFWKDSAAHKDDERHLTSLLDLLPRAYLVTPDGTDSNGCTRYRFEPNPAYQPSGYEERVGAAMGGTVSVREPANRLCTLEASLQHKVTFGYGILGQINSGGNFRLEREPVYGTEWKSDKIAVHLGGKILMIKSIAKDQDTVRLNVHVVPQDLTLTQAVDLLSTVSVTAQR